MAVHGRKMWRLLLLGTVVFTGFLRVGLSMADRHRHCAAVQTVRAKCYDRVAIVAWDCQVCAGDVREAWLACSEKRSLLTHNVERGWHGVVSIHARDCQRDQDDALINLAAMAARRPWQTIADHEGLPALAACTSKGDSEALARVLAGQMNAFVRSWPGQLTPQLAQALDIGPYLNCPVAAACSTGLMGLIEVADHLERGTCSHALAGAADRSLTPLLMAGFSAMGVLCGDRHPLDQHAEGFAPAEGSAFFALADHGHWRLRASVRVGDAGHETHFRDPATLIETLHALWSVSPHPTLIVIHGTGTAQGDAYERACLDAGPWARAERLSCKPYIGHCLGASGAVELAIALQAPVSRLWKISLGFGGHLAAVAMEHRDRR